MKKATIIIAVFCVMAMLFAGCGEQAKPHEHTLIHNETKAPTCTNNGIQENWMCLACGKRFSDAEATQEITFADVEIEETGHTEGEDDGDCTTAVNCVVCGEVASPGAANHTPAEDDGDCTTPIACTVCGKEVVPAKPAVVITIPALENGTITTDKVSYAAGETVTLTVTAAEGYAQKLTINGEPLLLSWETGKYSFVAEEGKTYEIGGSFVAYASQDVKFSQINVAHGILYAPAGNGTGGNGWYCLNDNSKEVAVKVKDYANGTQNEYQVSLSYKFDNGKKLSIRLIYWADGDRYVIQGAGDDFFGWNTICDLPDYKEAIRNEGVWFSAARRGDKMDLKINDNVVHTLDMSTQGVTAGTAATVARFGVTNFDGAGAFEFKFGDIIPADAVVIEIPEIANGTVVADKESYVLGDIVTLTVTPDAGYAQKLTINGEPLLLDWETGKYIFAATEKTYAISGSFVAYESQDVKFSQINAAHGVLYAPAGNGEGGNGWYVANGNCEEVSVKVIDYSAGEQDQYNVSISYKFEGGKKLTVRLISWPNSDKKYVLQSCEADFIADWQTLADLTDYADAIRNDGVWFTATRNGDKMDLMINDTVVYTVDLSTEGVTASTAATVGRFGYTNYDAPAEVPYSFEMVVPVPENAIVPSISAMENGKVVADKEFYLPGETVTLTITPDDGYAQKLTINGEPLLLGWKTNTYSFVAEEGKTYEIGGSFEESLTLAPSDANRFDGANQAHGVISTYYPTETESWWMNINGDFSSIAVNAKNYLPMEDSAELNGNVGYALCLSVTLDNGKLYAFRIINDKDIRYGYSHFGASGSVTGWDGWIWVDELDANATALIQGEGAEFKLERTSADTLTLTLNGTVMETYVMEGVTADNKVTSVGFRHYGHKGLYVDIPFEVK